MKAKRLKPGDPGYRHPYVAYEADPLWPLIEKGIDDLVKNQDLIEQGTKRKGRKGDVLICPFHETSKEPVFIGFYNIAGVR